MYKFLVDDNGHSHHKVAYLNHNDEISTFKVASSVSDGRNPITNTDGIPQDTYRIDGKDLCCSDQRLNTIEVRNERYQMSKANKALVAHAIAKAGLQDQDVILGVTVPWKEAFLNSGGLNKTHLQEVAEHYASGEMTNLTNNRQYHIHRCKAYPEGLSAFYDWAIQDDGTYQHTNKVLGPVGIIDIGGSTTDITTVICGSTLGIDHARSNTHRIGVIDAKEAVANHINDFANKDMKVNMDVSGGVPPWMLEQAFEKHSIQLGEHYLDLSDIVDSSKASVIESIDESIRKTLGNPLAYEVLVFVGGGAVVFADQLTKLYTNAQLSDEFATARGALKYMLKIDRAELLNE